MISKLFQKISSWKLIDFFNWINTFLFTRFQYKFLRIFKSSTTFSIAMNKKSLRNLKFLCVDFFRRGGGFSCKKVLSWKFWYLSIRCHESSWTFDFQIRYFQTTLRCIFIFSLAVILIIYRGTKKILLLCKRMDKLLKIIIAPSTHF